MFNWFKKKVHKEEFEHHKGAVQTALNSVKQDMGNLSKWINHLNKQDSDAKEDIDKILKEISSIKYELDDIREIISEKESVEKEPLFKQRQTDKHKQTAVYDVQTAVQTTVQAAFFNKLSISEKAIIGILVNSDMKLSYEDLAAMTGKDTATIRGQINSIKQKCEGIIEELVEKNNKKRLFIPENIKQILLKRVKVRGKKEKSEENEEKIA